MKDLKHLSCFEGLLHDSGNELTGNARRAIRRVGWRHYEHSTT